MHTNSKTYNEKEMNVTGHLTELRNRLIVTALFFITFFIISFIYVKEFYYFLVKDIEVQLNITSAGDIIWIYFRIAVIVAIVGTLAVLSIQIWLFIIPVLIRLERKASLPYMPAIFL